MFALNPIPIIIVLLIFKSMKTLTSQKSELNIVLSICHNTRNIKAFIFIGKNNEES